VEHGRPNARLRRAARGAILAIARVAVCDRIAVRCTDRSLVAVNARELQDERAVAIA
jgi:hypothetical protein